MALMKSNSGTSKGSGFLTDGMFVTRYGTDETQLRRAAAALGFEPSDVRHETVVQEIARCEANRALLVSEIVAALGSSGGTVDVAAIAAAVNDDAARRMSS